MIHAYKSSALADLVLQSAGGSGRAWRFVSDTDGKFYIRDNNAASNRLYIDTSGNVGIGTTSPNLSSSGTALTVNSSSGANAAVEISDGGTLAGLLWGRSGTGVNVWSIPSIPLIFGTANTERMRIDSSGNVGINYTTPFNQISGANETTLAISNSNVASLYLNNTATNGHNHILFSGTGGALSFYDKTRGDYNMVIDSSGNVGIGTTLPAKKLEVATTGINQSTTVRIQGTDGNGAGHPLDLKMDGATDSFSILIGQGGGATPSTVLFSGNRNGNVGIGTTSPVDRLTLYEGTNNNVGVYFQTATSGTTGADGFRVGQNNDNAFCWNYEATPLTFATSGTERMRITSDGKLGVNTSSFAPTTQFQIKLGNMGSGAVGEVFDAAIVNGASRLMLCSSGASGQVPIISMRHYSAAYGIDIWMEDSSSWNTRIDNRHASSGFIFRNNCNNDGGETELMRITGSGNVLMNCTSVPSGSGGGAAFETSGTLMRLKQSSPTTSTTKVQIYYNANGEVGSIHTSGTATAFNTSSDYRLKDDYKDFNGLDLVNNINVYDFEWKSDKTRSYGVKAHELQEVIPQAVNGEKDGKDMQQVDYSKLVPILLKSIQELQERIQILENN